MGEKSAVNGTSGVYSNKIPWRGSKIHLPNTELCVPNAVIVAFQSILEEQMPTIWVCRFPQEIGYVYSLNGRTI